VVGNLFIRTKLKNKKKNDQMNDILLRVFSKDTPLYLLSISLSTCV